MAQLKMTKEEIELVRLFVFGTCEVHTIESRLNVYAEISFLFERYLQWAKAYGKPAMDRVTFRKCLKKNFPGHVVGKYMNHCAGLKPRCWTDGTVRAVWDGRFDD